MHFDLTNNSLSELLAILESGNFGLYVKEIGCVFFTLRDIEDFFDASLVLIEVQNNLKIVQKSDYSTVLYTVKLVQRRQV